MGVLELELYWKSRYKLKGGGCYFFNGKLHISQYNVIIIIDDDDDDGTLDYISTSF